MKRDKIFCHEIVEIEHFKFSQDNSFEVIGCEVEKRQCNGGAKYKFQDGQILCYAHTSIRLCREALLRGEILDIHPPTKILNGVSTG